MPPSSAIADWFHSVCTLEEPNARWMEPKKTPTQVKNHNAITDESFVMQ